MVEPGDLPSGDDQPPDVDDLLAQLRARVEARRRAGAYPAGLEEEMSAHFHRILHQRRESRPLPDLRGLVMAAGRALPIQAAKIPLESGFPGGRMLHRAIARLVGRQTEGALQQVQAFAQPAQAALEAMAAAVEDLNRLVTSEVAQSLDALYERQAASERMLAAAGLTDAGYGQPRAEHRLPGAGEQLERDQDLAQRLVGMDPVLDFGARGVEREESLRDLRSVDDKALGALTALGIIEKLSPEEVVEFVALAADKVRPGGVVFVESGNGLCLDAGSIPVTHPATLASLFREAGFANVEIEPPGDLVVATR